MIFKLTASLSPITITTADTYNGPTSNAAGPAATVSSETVVLHPVNTTYVCPEIGAVPFGAVGTVRVKPPSMAVALHDLVSQRSSMVKAQQKHLRSKDWAGNRNESAVEL